MVGEPRAPGVQHERGADVGAQMLRISGEGAQRFGRDVEQQPVDDGLVVPGDGTDRRGQREDDVIVLDRCELSPLTVKEPNRFRRIGVSRFSP
jgi:hypothetical protein